MSAVRISRRKRLLGYMVLQAVFLLPEVEADHSLGAGTPPCIYVPSAAWILQTLLTRARTAPVFVAPILAADAAQQVTQFRPGLGRP